MPEIARAAGFGDFWKDIMTQDEFNHLSKELVPVLTDARPYGRYSMVDIDEVGGVQVLVRELLEAGLLNGDVMTCTGQTLAQQVEALETPAADGTVVYPASKPYKPTGGLRLLKGNLSPDFGAVLKLAGVEGGLENNVFAARLNVSTVSKAYWMRWSKTRINLKILTWSLCVMKGQAAHRACRKCLILPRALPPFAESGTL